MIRHPRGQPAPAGVLVLTVWSEAGGLRRVISTTDTQQDASGTNLELHRQLVGSDTAALGIVRAWLQAIGERGRGPDLRAVPDGDGDAAVTPSPRSGDESAQRLIPRQHDP